MVILTKFWKDYRRIGSKCVAFYSARGRFCWTKGLCLARASGVTKFITTRFMSLVTLCCASGAFTLANFARDFALSLHVLLNKNYLFSLLNVQASTKSRQCKHTLSVLDVQPHCVFNPPQYLLYVFVCNFSFWKNGKGKNYGFKKIFWPKRWIKKKIWLLMRLLQLIKMKCVKHVSTVKVGTITTQRNDSCLKEIIG